MKARDGNAPNNEAQEQVNIIFQMKDDVVVGFDMVMIQVSLKERITKHMAALAQ